LEGLGDVGEVEGARVEAAERIVGVDELHIVPCYLLWRSGEVVKVQVWERLGPVCVD
jgi:hypothetical protein